jgi:hypothetical protein
VLLTIWFFMQFLYSNVDGIAWYAHVGDLSSAFSSHFSSSSAGGAQAGQGVRLMRVPRVVVINPYIYDFAAYSFWSSPLGLLYIAGILRRNGFHVDLVDCMSVREEKRKPDGRAPFIKHPVPKPDALRGVRKTLRRYGMPPEELSALLERMSPPDVILVTSIMTYWYVGAMEVVDLARRIHPRSRIAVGGIYPALCPEQARASFSAADLVVSSGDMGRFYGFVEAAVGESSSSNRSWTISISCPILLSTCRKTYPSYLS